MKANKGITLIALIITVIIMLILVAVTIDVVIDGKLFDTAKEAVDKTNDKVGEQQDRVDGLMNELDDIYEWQEGQTEGGEGEEIDWNTILADAQQNPDKYKHPEQSSTNGDIGIGTDGKPVNLDLWGYMVKYDNGINLNTRTSSISSSGYSNSNINIETGEIQGKVPQYIKIDGEDEFYKVTQMYGTFYGCTNLKVAPKIPSTVTSIAYAFYGCNNLVSAPEIPSSVTDSISYAFKDCNKLTGTIVINANPTYYAGCFYNAATETGTDLILTGTSTILDDLVTTGNGNIRKGN